MLPIIFFWDKYRLREVQAYVLYVDRNLRVTYTALSAGDCTFQGVFTNQILLNLLNLNVISTHPRVGKKMFLIFTSCSCFCGTSPDMEMLKLDL